MVLRRRRYIRRRGRRYYRRRNLFKPRMTKQERFAFKQYSFKRTAQLATITGDPALDVMGAYYFTLADVPNPANFADLGDEYKITTIVLRVYPQLTTINNANAGAYAGGFAEAIDYNDASVPTNAGAVREYQSCRTHNPYKPFKVVIHPKNSTPVYNGTFTNAYIATRGWISTAYTDVRYYGWKYAITNQANLATGSHWVVMADYYIKVRGVK